MKKFLIFNYYLLEIVLKRFFKKILRNDYYLYFIVRILKRLSNESKLIDQKGLVMWFM